MQHFRVGCGGYVAGDRVRGAVPEEKVMDILTMLYLTGDEGKLAMCLMGECVDCRGCPWRIRPAATRRRKTGAAASTPSPPRKKERGESELF